MSAAPASAGRLRRLYIDTSAYLSVLLGDEGATRLAEEMTGAELLSSVLLVLETKRNLVRLAREAVLDADQYRLCAERSDADFAALFVLRDLTLDLCESHIVPAVTTPRSLDLAHLRTAHWFHSVEPLDRFVTLDAAQGQAAREIGLPV